MKKIILFGLVILIAVSAFAQDYTFQGLPWGSTKEQVIAKLGEPSARTNKDRNFYYLVSLSGYRSQLLVSFFGNDGLEGARYRINPFKDLSEDQVKITFIILLN